MPAAAAAQVAQDTVTHTSRALSFTFPDHWPTQSEIMNWMQSMGPAEAALLIMCGVVYIIFGYQIFKWLIFANAAFIGGWVGAIVGSKAGGHPIVGAGLCALLAGAITWPLTKYAVAAMGGLMGALIGATVWNMAELNPELAWSGALTGLVFFGLLSFMLFRGCIMAYTSLQGSVMLIFGIISMAYKYPSVASNITEQLKSQHFILPIAVFIPTLLGVLYQNYNYPPAPPPGKK